MNKAETIKSKNLFDEEKLIDTGVKKPLFVSIPLDEYKKLQEENAELKEEIKDLIEENHKHIDYIADMKKKHEDKIRTKIKELEHKDFIAMQVARKHDKEALKIVDVLKELLGDDE